MKRWKIYVVAYIGLVGVSFIGAKVNWLTMPLSFCLGMVFQGVLNRADVRDILKMMDKIGTDGASHYEAREKKA